MATAVSPAEAFNALVRKMFNDFRVIGAPGLKSQVQIRELQSKMVSGMRSEPAFAITMLSPMIVSVGSQILQGDAKYFLDHDYGGSVMALSRAHKFNYDDAMSTIAYMKAAYRAATEQQKAGITDTLQKMLAIAAKFTLDSRR